VKGDAAMEDKLYKCRVVVEVVMDVDAWGCHEDNAGAAAEEIADDVIHQQLGNIEDEDVFVASWGVRCIDVEPANYAEGE
jgi:hypothetical protein